MVDNTKGYREVRIDRKDFFPANHLFILIYKTYGCVRSGLIISTKHITKRAKNIYGQAAIQWPIL